MTKKLHKSSTYYHECVFLLSLGTKLVLFRDRYIASLHKCIIDSRWMKYIEIYILFEGFEINDSLKLSV